MQAKLKLTVLFIITVAITNAQSTHATMTNATVIKLVKCGLDNDIIITTIESASGKYDVTPGGLATLRAAGVSPTIVKALTVKMQAGTVEKVTSGGSAPTGTNAIPVPDVLNTVYLYDKAGQRLDALEKANATQKTHRAGLGYGATTYTCEIQGSKSTTRLKESDTNSFMVNAGNGSPDNLKLFKVETKKNQRSAITSKISGMGSMKGAQGTIAFEMKMLKAGVFEIIPTDKLEKGEYLFTTKSFDYTTMANMDVFAFGVD